MGDVLLLDEWTDVHVALRDLERTHVELSKTHDLMIIRRVSLNLNFIDKYLSFIGESAHAALPGGGLYWEMENRGGGRHCPLSL